MFYNSKINIDENLWMDILNDKNITTKPVLDIFFYLLTQPKQESSAPEIAKSLHYKHFVILNQVIPNFSKRILKKYNFVETPKRENGTKRYWHIPFLGKDEGSKFIWILRPELTNALLNISDYEIDNYYLPEEITEENILKSEGKVVRVCVNIYERNKSARKICLNKYGYKCCVCGFDFEEKYGPIGKGKIHVHHIVSISNYKKEYILNPETDLRPVCPNCHLIIHSGREPLTIEELKNITEIHKNY
jgi:5-methylcytosine-specific restriction protein A